MNTARKTSFCARLCAVMVLGLFAPASVAYGQADQKAPPTLDHSPPNVTPQPPLRLPPQVAPPPAPPLSEHSTPEGALPLPDASDRGQAEAERQDETDTARDEDLDPAEALERAFADLKSDDEEAQAKASQTIVKLWSRSGSAAMDLLLQRARTALERKDLDAAQEHLTDLVTLAPEFAEGWHARAQIHALRDDYGAALFDLAETIALEQRHFLAFAELGALLEDLGREEEALTAFRRALAIHPGFDAVKNAIERLSPTIDGRDA